MEQILGEQLWYGGELKSRRQIYDALVGEGFEQRYINFYLFCLARHQPGESRLEEGREQPSE